LEESIREYKEVLKWKTGNRESRRRKKIDKWNVLTKELPKDTQRTDEQEMMRTIFITRKKEPKIYFNELER
jgi:hypothetical protein